MQISERMRLQLLREEFRLRKKQPQAWTAQKYRKYANIGIRKKKEKPEFIEEEREMETRLTKEKHKKHAAIKKKAKRQAKKIKRQKKATARRSQKKQTRARKQKKRMLGKKKR